MELKEKFESIKEKIILAYNSLLNWVGENTKQAVLICITSILFLVCIILLFCLKPKKEKKIPDTQIVLTEELLIPPSPALPNGYNNSRITKDKWSNEEIDKWFTKPSDKEIDDLAKANDKIISEITGAAP